MNTHELQVASDPFKAIRSGKKTIESRLFDEKRQRIQLSDEIVFINRDDPSLTCKVKVTKFLRYNTFAELFRSNSPAKFGRPNPEWLERQINEFYSADQQAKYGVIGIEFELI